MIAVVIKIVRAIFRLRFIQPEQLNAKVVVVLFNGFPNKLPCLRMSGIIEGGVTHKIEVDLYATVAGDQPAFRLHLWEEWAAGFYRRPDGHHQFNAERFQFFNHGFWVWPVNRIKTPGALIRPVEEINNHHGQRQMSAVILARHLQHLLLVAVAQFALPQSADEFRGGRGSPGRTSVLTSHLRDAVACRYPVIHFFSHPCGPYGVVFRQYRFTNGWVVP